jgi:hypothetical protein
MWWTTSSFTDESTTVLWRRDNCNDTIAGTYAVRIDAALREYDSSVFSGISALMLFFVLLRFVKTISLSEKCHGKKKYTRSH